MNIQHSQSSFGANQRNNNEKAKVNQILMQDYNGEDQTSHVHAATIEHQGVNKQFFVLQTLAEYEGKDF
ncbi:hypothetical protein, partial [Escherichia coli]|uniref:hypothetical protein n=1 Tax=Escherichia coli TaxID=562 RepID=UPI00142E47B4